MTISKHKEWYATELQCGDRNETVNHIISKCSTQVPKRIQE